MKKEFWDAGPGVIECNGIEKLVPKIGTSRSHSFNVVSRRKGREERAGIIPKIYTQGKEYTGKLIHNKVGCQVTILFVL